MTTGLPEGVLNDRVKPASVSALLTHQVLVRFGTMTVWFAASVPVNWRRDSTAPDGPAGGALADRSSVPPVTALVFQPAIAFSRMADTWLLWLSPQLLLSFPVPMTSQPRMEEKVSAGMSVSIPPPQGEGGRRSRPGGVFQQIPSV